jgi:hypothetical protein
MKTRQKLDQDIRVSSETDVGGLANLPDAFLIVSVFNGDDMNIK